MKTLKNRILRNYFDVRIVCIVLRRYVLKLACCQLGLCQRCKQQHFPAALSSQSSFLAGYFSDLFLYIAPLTEMMCQSCIYSFILIGIYFCFSNSPIYVASSIDNTLLYRFSCVCLPHVKASVIDCECHILQCSLFDSFHVFCILLMARQRW